MSTKTLKIAHSFGQAAAIYDQNGILQKASATAFADYLKPWLQDLIPGPSIELGCGTGLLSQTLQHHLGIRNLYLTDISKEMIEVAQQKLGHPPHLKYGLHDANQGLQKNHFALIASALAIQWLNDPVRSMLDFTKALKPQGRLILSFLAAGSFPQWKAATEAINIPFTANPLPCASKIKPLFEALPGTLQWAESTLTLDFSNAHRFFHNLKSIGASVQMNQTAISTRQMRKLTRYLDQQNPVGLLMSHQICYLCYQAADATTP